MGLIIDTGVLIRLEKDRTAVAFFTYRATCGVWRCDPPRSSGAVTEVLA